jgi:protein-S-isoprenylcysteine O-methyltransferase Ste14
MDVSTFLLQVIFFVVVVSLVAARVFFFKVQSRSSRMVSYINDPAVVIQIASFYYCSTYDVPYFFDWRFVVVLFLIGLALFYWSILTAKSLNFANSGSSGDLITSGPYAVVRHPLYLSYFLFWAGNSLLYFHWIAILALLILSCVYVYSARNEEAYLLEGEAGAGYRAYQAKVGMFFPKLR